MEGIELSGPGLAAIVALLLSLALSYIPGFKYKWEECAYKREALGLSGLLVAIGLIGLHYLGAFDLGLEVFGWPVVWRALEAWLAFAGAGQLSYTVQQRSV